MNKIFTFLLIYFWSTSVSLIQKILQFFSLFNSQLSTHLKARDIKHKKLNSLKIRRKKNAHSICFFCSSAGEYEQAIPLIKKYENKKDTFVFIIFFSQSAWDYAHTQKETTVFFLCPFDTLSNWRKLNHFLKPNLIIVVRHEFWPSFLWYFSRKSHLVLINASCVNNKKMTFLKKTYKSFVFSFFHLIFTTDYEQENTFKKQFNIPSTKLRISFDTKFERVFERKKNNLQTIKKLHEIFPKAPKDSLRLILGSAWEEDIKLCLESLQLIKNEKKITLQLFCIPHKLNSKNFKLIESLCSSLRLSFSYYPNKSLQPPQFHTTDVIIINKLGILAELYALGDCAFVGGALHNKVHNVLEPFAHGNPVAFGAKYLNSHEAIKLVNNKLAAVITNPQQMLTWFLQVNALKYHVTQNISVMEEKYLSISHNLYKKLNKDFLEHTND